MLLNIIEHIVNDEVIQQYMIHDPISMEVVMMCLHPEHVEIIKLALEIATKCCFAASDDGDGGYDLVITGLQKNQNDKKQPNMFVPLLLALESQNVIIISAVLEFLVVLISSASSEEMR